MGSGQVSSCFLPSDGKRVVMEGMPRRLRLQYPDAIYHLMARGNGRQDIVCDDVDRDRLLQYLGLGPSMNSCPVPVDRPEASSSSLTVDVEPFLPGLLGHTGGSRIDLGFLRFPRRFHGD